MNKLNNHSVEILNSHYCLHRCKMSVDYLHYNSQGMKRQLGPNWPKDPGCEHQPLFKIPLKDIVIDELHLMLRVTDRLEKGIIFEVIDWDEVCIKHHIMADSG